jgi:hypothetical protein
MVKTENINFRISPDQKQALEKRAGERGENLSQIVSSAVDFYLAFPPGFMAELQKISDMVKLPISVVIVHLMQVYSAQDAALIKYFGKSKTFSRAFRFDPKKGLLSGDELSDLVFAEVSKEIEGIIEKAERSKRVKKPAELKIDEASLLSQLL